MTLRAAASHGVAVLIFSASATAQPATTTRVAEMPVGAAAGVSAVAVEFFPIMPWGPLHGWQDSAVKREERDTGLPGMADCQFTMGGFVQPRDLPECERLGLKAIMAPPPGDTPSAAPWRSLSDDAIEARVGRLLAQGGQSPAVVGYYLMDEPGTRDFAALGKAVAAIRKRAPGKLAYINLLPGYATIGAPDTSQLGAASFTEYLERFVAEVHPQFLSYDNYMVQYSDDLRNANAAKYYRDLLEVRRISLKHGLPFWNIVSSNQIRPETTIPSPANMMFQAFTTLAAGGRGVSWYTYYGSNRSSRGYGYAPVDGQGNLWDTWLYLQMVNRHLRTLGPLMNRLTSTGVYFSSPLPVADLPALPGQIIQSVNARVSRRETAEIRPSIMVGEFTAADGFDYFMLVNLSLHDSTNVEMTLRPGAGARELVSAADGRWRPLDESKGLWMVAGGGCLIRCR